MSQSAKMSLVEIAVATAVKFLWATFLWHFVVGPLFSLPTAVSQSFLITFIFMANGTVIAYLFRRLFNRIEVVKNERAEQLKAEKGTGTEYPYNVLPSRWH